jgi:23S rRNA (adenine2503-C2)-methyltransferase
MSNRKTNLLGCTLAELGEFVQSLGEPRYRGAQLFQWLYRHGAPSFGAMTSLGREFRALLAESACIEGLRPVTQQVSAADGTTKYLFELADGFRIESVLIPPASAFSGSEAAAEEEQKRLTVCVSTQVGCPLDCAFCATAAMGFRRNLGPGEIVDQVLQVRRLSGRSVTNVVFMGMGEPLMNYDAVMAAAEIMVNGIGLAARRITISTAGWVEGIRRLASADLKVKLAVSLHSAEETTRVKLMPVTRRHSLMELMDAVEEYYRRTKRRVTYEVIFFDDVNDSPDAVRHLIRLARRVPSKINVIPFHAIGTGAPLAAGTALRPSTRTAGIVEQLRASNLTVMVRSSAGEDIDAACGQLAVRTERRTASSGGRRLQRMPTTHNSP